MNKFISKPRIKKLKLPIAERIVIFDLEWTSWSGFPESNWCMPGKHREIIQIGGVKLDYTNHLKEIDCFNIFVKPKINKKLSKYIRDLTGLTQEIIDSRGINFHTALTLFYKFCNEVDYVCFNGTDDEVLFENCQLLNIECPKIFTSGVNLAPLLSSSLDNVHQWVSSGELTKYLNISDGGPQHDALSDSRSLASGIRYLMKN